jgi:hypothetical protein
MNKHRVAIILAFLLMFSLALLAGPPQTVVSVTITNPNDKPVDNASVILDFLGSHQFTKLGKRKPIHWEVHTNQNGVAHFPQVPQGTIQRQVDAKNYQTFGKKYEIDVEEKMIDIKLNPPQEQYSAHPPLKPADPTK